MTEKAIAKIKSGMSRKLDRYGEAMKKEVADALITFIRQDAEFAQAVVVGGSFADCMTAVAKEIKGGSISDMTAYGAAVRFFFPGAEIKVKMTIDLVGAAADPAEDAPETTNGEDSGAVIIDLSDFF